MDKNNSCFKAYIILVNYNNAADTIECLESLLKINDPDFQVIVVDNSTEDCIAILRSWASGDIVPAMASAFPAYVLPLVSKPIDAYFIEESAIQHVNQQLCNQVLFIKANNNNGFAAANNIALKYTLKFGSADSWAWILNNDTVVSPDLLMVFRSYVASLNSAKIGIIGTKLFYYKYPEKLQGIAGVYNPYNGKTKHVGAFEEDNGQFDNFNYAKFDYVIGASLFVSLKFLEEVGLMAEDYFLYYEEIDWITRGLQKNWHPGFLSQGKVYHKEGASIDADANTKSDMADYYICRNMLIFTINNLPEYTFFIRASLLIRLIIRLIRFEFTRVKSVFRILFYKRTLKEKFQ